MCVYKAADYRENKQDMKEHLILRQSVIKDTDTAYHRDKVKELAEEYRNDFPQHGKMFAKIFSPFT